MARCAPQRFELVFIDPPFDADLFEQGAGGRGAAGRAPVASSISRRTASSARRSWDRWGCVLHRHLRAGAVHAHLLQTCKRRLTPGYTAAAQHCEEECALTSVTRLTAVYPGTFDPMTLGHEDLMRRASRLFERLILAVAAGHHKRTMFTIAERLEIAAEIARQVPERRGDGLPRPAARLRRRPRRQGGGARPARGERLRLRVPDGRHEPPADARGRDAVPHAAATSTSSSSGTFVREIATLGGDVSKFVSPSVLDRLRERVKSTEP